MHWRTEVSAYQPEVPVQRIRQRASIATLQAIGVDEEAIWILHCVSASVYLQHEEEVDYTLQQMYDMIPVLRRYRRLGIRMKGL